jgi:hypothetical protein
LVSRWKLQDPGVTFTYVKTDKLPSGTTVDILQLTFSAVGAARNENKYWLYVDKEDHLIKQWAYYKNFNDADQVLEPWNNYQSGVTSYFLLTDPMKM